MTRLPKLCLGVLALLFTLAGPALADDTKGTVRSVNGERNEVVLKGVVNDATYPLRKDAWVILDGRKVKVTELKEGDRAQISYEKVGNDNVAFGVRVLRNASEAHGTIRHVIADKNQIVLKGLVKDTTYNMDKGAKVYINLKDHNLSDLRENDDVYVTYLRGGPNNDVYTVTEIRCVRK